MSDWIEINLPWRDSERPWPKYKDYPDLSERGKAVFGETVDEVKERTILSTKGKESYQFPILDAFNKLRSEIESELIEHDVDQNKETPFEEYNAEVRSRLEALNNPNVKMVFEYRDFKKKYDEWLDSQPEIKAVAEYNERVQVEFKEKQLKEGMSFRARDLNRAGTLIEVKSVDGKVNQMMIGTINELGGSCDDCAGISDNDIVLRYKVLWSPKE